MVKMHILWHANCNGRGSEGGRETVREGETGAWDWTDPLIALVGNPPFWFAFKSHFSATDDD